MSKSSKLALTWLVDRSSRAITCTFRRNTSSSWPERRAPRSRDSAEEQPASAVGAGVLSLYWLVQADVYDSRADIGDAHGATLAGSFAGSGQRGSAERLRQNRQRFAARRERFEFVALVEAPTARK